MGRKRQKKIFDQIDIIDIANRGKCIGRADTGEIVLVEEVVPGDVVKGNALRKKKGMWMVRVDQFIEKSADRVTPKCQHFDDCGGCKWQHLSMDKQLFYKNKQVVETIKRLGGVESFNAYDIVPSPREFEFRNKMEFSFSDSRWLSRDEVESEDGLKNKGGLGLHPPGWFQKVVDLETCHLIPNRINEIRNFIRDASRDLNLTFYNPMKHVGDMRNIMMRINRAGEVMVVFIFGAPILDAHKNLMEKTQKEFSDIVSIYSILNQKANDSTFDLGANLIYGEQYLQETIGAIHFNIGPKSFFQTNIYQTEQVYAEVKKLAQLTGEEIVFDLYSGIGSIALYVADQAKEVVAVEDVAEAVEDARVNAQLNNIDHITYHTGKMEQLIDADALGDLPRPDVIITDPPRAGMHQTVVQFILQQAPKRIVYVSCDPSTQARDIKLLSDAYELVSIKPFDMFPHTSHIECVALLIRRG
ncbi:UNVERIFIED_CONTAM: hypothetical protein GTU68_044294 [Idotea baltica]|nr:hypothetical protein [Idotea baltica]